MPPKKPLTFDPIWDRLDSENLKRIARNYGGKQTWRREECVAFLRAAIKDEERVRDLVSRQQEHARSFLALIKYLGGEVERLRLKMAVYASGIRLPGDRFGYHDPFTDALRKFLRNGVAFNATEYGSPADIRDFWGAVDIIFSDPRVLEHVGGPNFQPIDAEPVPAPAAAAVRTPRLISMQLIGILNTIESMHGLKITKTNAVRVTESRKLAKLMDWKDDTLVEGDFVLPNAVDFTVHLLREAGLLSAQKEILLPTPLAREFAEWPVEDQVRLLVKGVIQNRNWFETDSFYVGGYAKNWLIGRFALFTFLNCLTPNPSEPAPFYTVEDIDLALFQRIGEHFSLRTDTPHFYTMERDPKAAERSYLRWLADQRDNWLKVERVWLEHALKTWMYFLGLVSLEMHSGRPVTVAVSDLGRAVLNPGAAAVQLIPQPVESMGHPAWVVQPNFDVIAYLDYLSNAQLTFLERNAERLRAGDHVAEYRITRESVYRGLESGYSVDDMLATWQRESGKELPQNVAVEVREWAGMRDRMTLYRRADLAEFTNAEARQAAMENGMKGTLVGDRFLLITQPISKAETKRFYSTIDYSRPPMRCLTIDEDGTVTITEHSDLILENQLKEWVETGPDGSLCLTRASIERAINAGRAITTLFKLLEERIARLMPPIMQIALRAWAGQSYQVGYGSVQVLFSPSPDISYAIQNSALLRPFLRGVLAPGYFLVKTELLEELKAKLNEFGLEVQLIEVAQRN